MDKINFATETETIVIGLVTLVIIFGMGYLLVRASERRSSADLLLVVLSVLTLVSMVLFAITNSETLATISATGVGALAGGVTAMFTRDRNKDK